MDPLAQELNDTLSAQNPCIYNMLSSLGQALFFPRGILAQSAEAKEKAYRFNATIGIALEQGTSMHLACIQDLLADLHPDEVYPYAPAAGKPALRDRWRVKQLDENPLMRGKRIGRPIVTSALTHGLSLVGDLFVDPGDLVVLPDKFWGNYRLIYHVRRGARLVTYPLYNESGGFNVKGLSAALAACSRSSGKALVILNFPNNPCGYMITPTEAEGIAAALRETAERGTLLVVILDEAYFGLFYEDNLLTESLFGYLANTHERILAVKLDAATKEEFVWGFRVGFLSYGAGGSGDLDQIYAALEKKTMGAIRSSISNSSHLAQTLVLKALEHPDFARQRNEKVRILKRRALKVKEALKNPDYGRVWTAYPFNAGYFMCLRLKNLDAEKVRLYLLDRYGIGVIASGPEDIRIAFSCIEEADIEELFATLYKAASELLSGQAC
jgi:aspartate/methionine/tyrosine aminotransferase